MITKDTAARIAFAYTEIEHARTLLAELEKSAKDKTVPDFRDAFGRQRGLTLGVPSGGGYRLMDVNPILGEAVIRAHISNKEAEIAAMCEVARNELRTDARAFNED